MEMLYRAHPDLALSPGDIGIFISWTKGSLPLSDEAGSPTIGIDFIRSVPGGEARLAIKGSDDPDKVGAALTRAVRKDYWLFE